jgi:hypothetical protein
MAMVVDPKTHREELVFECFECSGKIYWSKTDQGARRPYDVVDGRPTRQRHAYSCPAKRFVADLR